VDDQQFSLSMARTMSPLLEEGVEQTAIWQSNVEAEVNNYPNIKNLPSHFGFQPSSNQRYNVSQVVEEVSALELTTHRMAILAQVSHLHSETLKIPNYFHSHVLTNS
jgi:hypothetical protein